MRRHLVALDALDPKFGELYRALALRTVPMSLAAGGMTSERAEEIRTLLASRSATPPR
ncbi:MAG: hypothetical protein JOZ85_01785 [Betaproteobacteria bacterium]|nr:hypothetical protein [Betaproteobacteria bacterium]